VYHDFVEGSEKSKKECAQIMARLAKEICVFYLLFDGIITKK
jgi:hypothetical protein